MILAWNHQLQRLSNLAFDIITNEMYDQYDLENSDWHESDMKAKIVIFQIAIVRLMLFCSSTQPDLVQIASVARMLS